MPSLMMELSSFRLEGASQIGRPLMHLLLLVTILQLLGNCLKQDDSVIIELVLMQSGLRHGKMDSWLGFFAMLLLVSPVWSDR